MTWDKLTEPIIHWGKTWSKLFFKSSLKNKQTNKQTFLISLDSWQNGKVKKEHLLAHLHGRQLFCVFVRSQFHRPRDGWVISFNLRLADGCWQSPSKLYLKKKVYKQTRNGECSPLLCTFHSLTTAWRVAWECLQTIHCLPCKLLEIASVC